MRFVFIAFQTVAWSGLGIILAGCAAVDPGPDYAVASNHVQEATGQAVVLQPDNAAGVDEQIQQILANGLTAEEAVQLFLISNPRIRARLFDIGIARAEVVQAGLPSNPNLSFGVNFPDGGGLAKFEMALAQNIADLWQIPPRRRAAEKNMERTILQVASDVAAGTTEVKTAYYLALQGDQKLKIAGENVQIAQQVLDLALARQQAGAGGEVDVNLARVEVHDAELAQRRATLEAFESRSNLARLLSLRLSPAELTLCDAPLSDTDWKVTDETLISLAEEHRLDLRAATGACAAAEAEVQSEWAKVIPSLEIGTSFERSERRPSPHRNILGDTARASLDAGEPKLDIAPREKNDGQETLAGPTIGMELPIFNQNQGGIARAQYAYRQTREILHELKVQIAQEVRLARERVKAAQSNVAFYRDQVIPIRESSLELARTAYQAGRTSLLNVLEAERALLEARAGQAESRYAAATALAELEKATNQPLARLLEGAPEKITADTCTENEVQLK